MPSNLLLFVRIFRGENAQLKILRLYAALGIIIAVCIGTAKMAPLEGSELAVIQANGKFTNNLYKELAKQEGNVFFSPISAHAVLSMAYQGANGDTKAAFASTLGVPDNKLAANGYSKIMDRLNSVENVTLLMANKVFLKSGLALQEEFGKTAKEDFKSEVQQVDFAKNVAAAQTINSWVEDKTKNKIKDLITPDSLDGMTRLVLVNAIYFKGDWLSKFDKANTRKMPFYTSETVKSDVDMMFRKGEYKYKFDRDLDAQVLELPYKNRDLSMIVVLPNKKDGIKGLEQKLAATDITKVTEGMYPTDVEVFLPKFKIETTIDLNQHLENMGLGVMFSDNANFDKMITGNEPLKVSKVIQKAFIEVNEEGSEAAAATAIIVFATSALAPPPPQPIFKADHPFIVYLVDASKNNINKLFFGKIYKL
ncbi:unnamed protein product [Brassicogethes aeneus]|uniref:Serpin domain-containing protein n=1 Tax=Brassicogethes aeneus TaxID=1431903 RepID=A0A9P0B616_BRAAE|nr:unnamed protein product [Brassicogethes aeneus]